MATGASNDLEPSKRVAPGTHPLELERLALQEQTHPDCDPLRVQALIWVFRAYSALLNAQSQELRAIGLSPSAFNALMVLLNTADHVLEPCDIAERLLVSRPSVTGLLDTLQRKGLIERSTHPDDRRRVLVRLTTEAVELLDGHWSDHYAAQRAALGGLTDDELAQLVTLLRKIPGAVPAHMQDGG